MSYEYDLTDPRRGFGRVRGYGIQTRTMKEMMEWTHCTCGHRWIDHKLYDRNHSCLRCSCPFYYEQPTFERRANRLILGGKPA